jgi:hypothetical protein
MGDTPEFGKPGFIIPEAMAWENFTLQVGGADMLQCQSFKLEYSATVTFNRGKGGHRSSYSITEYNEESDASVLVEDLAPLFTVAKVYAGDLRKIPLVVVIATLKTGAGLLKLTIPSTRIVKFSIGSKTGDSNTEVPLTFAVTSYPIITLEP